MDMICMYKLFISLQFLMELPIMLASRVNIPVVISLRIVEYFSTSGSTVASFNENFSKSHNSPTTVCLKYLFKIIRDKPRLSNTDNYISKRSDVNSDCNMGENSKGSASSSSQILKIS